MGDGMVGRGPGFGLGARKMTKRMGSGRGGRGGVGSASGAIWLGAMLLACPPASMGAAGDEIQVAGITEPFLDVTLGTAVPGILGARRFNEGDFVKEGEVVMELRKAFEELEVVRRKLVADMSKSEYERTRSLFERTKSVSQEELDKKETEFHVAQVEHDLALEGVQRRKVVATLSGTIVEFHREVGESCQVEDPLVRIVDTRRCYFLANIDARFGARLKLDQPVTLDIEAGEKPVPVRGRVSFISPVVDPASGLLKVKVLFENPEQRVRPGVAGTMRLPPAAP